jgi:cysteinyl-tRNA synthetase
LVTYASFRQVVIGADRSNARPSDAVLTALSDDLNTPAATAELHQLAARARSSAGVADQLVGSLLLLGFDQAVDHVGTGVRAQEDAAKAFQEVSAREIGLDPTQVNMLVATRNAARNEKNFKESDRIRDELAAMGVVLKDSKEGTTWEIAR